MVLFAKIVAGVVGGAVLLAVLYVAFVILRKSVPYVLRSDVELLAASGPYNNPELATEICGVKVDYLGGAPEPARALPRARLIGWWPILPSEGTASVRISGVGATHRDDKVVTGVCEATMTFKYRCRWVDNGRAVVLEKGFLERPTVVRTQ